MAMDEHLEFLFLFGLELDEPRSLWNGLQSHNAPLIEISDPSFNGGAIFPVCPHNLVNGKSVLLHEHGLDADILLLGKIVIVKSLFERLDDPVVSLFLFWHTVGERVLIFFLTVYPLFLISGIYTGEQGIQGVQGEQGEPGPLVFPEPKFESDWIVIPNKTAVIDVPHSVGGDPADYFIYLTYRRPATNGTYTSHMTGDDKIWWEDVEPNNIQIATNGDATNIFEAVKIRIWKIGE